ncbi:MAG TPA: hypothetical protein VLF18_16290 [Tahibacter sp.]|uniref:hypothetical protein n=1 Tax=Tahibacter sp. TaxID=2056211 RepID=UPI002C4F926F|nr:hypothetical protein [Tahibacter sp.]HSX61752.1 hypothetical protein [Tahibacter sp.]
MDAWIERLMQGIDPDAPDASLQLFLRIMGMVDWMLLFWLTLACMAVGGLIGWWRGAFWRDVALAAALGPLGWIVSLLLPPPRRACRACGRPNPLSVANCRYCGASMAKVSAGRNTHEPK